MYYVLYTSKSGFTIFSQESMLGIPPDEVYFSGTLEECQGFIDEMGNQEPDPCDFNYPVEY